MANRPSRIEISVPTASADGKYYGRYPKGNAPVGSGALSGSAIAQAVATGILTSFPSIVTSTLPVAIVGTPYSVQLVAHGGVTPYTWAAVGSLPSWLSLSASGLLTGTPTVVETDSITVKLTDAAGTVAQNVTLSLTVALSAFQQYISLTGNDANDGLTPSTAWALTTLLPTNANNAKLAGKRTGLMPGLYPVMTLTGISSYSGSFDAPYLRPPCGTSGAPTVLASCQADGTAWPADALGRGGPGYDGSGNWLGAELDFQQTLTNATGNQPGIGNVGNQLLPGWLTLDGIRCRNIFARAISIGVSTQGFGGYTGTHAQGIVVQNCDVHSLNYNQSASNACGITIYSGLNALVQNCHLTDFWDSTGRASFIEFWTCISCVMQYCTGIATKNGSGFSMGEAFLAKNATNKGNTIRFCYADMTQAASGSFASTLDCGDAPSGTTVTWDRNIFISDNPINEDSIPVSPFPNTAGSEVFTNNLFKGIPGFSVGAVRRFTGAGKLTFTGNIIDGTSVGGRGHLETNVSSLASIDYNVYPASPALGLEVDGGTDYPISGHGGTTYTTLAAWAAALPSGCLGKDANTELGAPTYVGGTPTLPAQKYKLALGSKGKGTGPGGTDKGPWGGNDVNTGLPVSQIGCSFA